MQSSAFADEEFTAQYTIAVDALYEIARAYFFLGKSNEAQQVLRTSLQLLETSEATPHHRLKLLTLYGQVLIIEHFITGKDADSVFAVINQARQAAEEAQDQQGIADTLALLGHAHYATTLKSSSSPNSSRDEGKYVEALAYQEQALDLREKLHDTRGISESLFLIGTVYERWQEHEQAQENYAKALQIAEQYDHQFEKAEPTRHTAAHALRQGKIDQAISLATRVVELREASGFKPYLPYDHLLLANMYMTQGDMTNAKLHARKASALATEMGRPTLVTSLPGMSTLLADEQQEA